jgi:ApaG protein
LQNTDSHSQATHPTIGSTLGQKRPDGLFGWQVTSNDITVRVVPEFLPERSSPEQFFFSYAYHVTITNNATVPVQLLGRTWLITDGTGFLDTVEGDGVVGEQPWIQPGQSYQYTSGCPLRTPTGNMRGWYHFQTVRGAEFSSRIPLFFLRPDSIKQ